MGHSEAGRFDSLHGDEHMHTLSMADAERIGNRTKELLEEKFRDINQFRDLMAGIDSDDFVPQLHRALIELDNACAGDPIASAAVLQSLTNIQKRIKDESEDWREECEGKAEREMMEGEL